MDIRERILEAAGRLYCESGFRGATTRRIASEAGVNEVTVFRQFGSKELLLREAIGRDWAAVDCPRPPAQPADVVAEVTAWALAFTDRLRLAAPLIRTCMGEFEEHPEIVPPSGSPTARAARALVVYLEQLSDRGLTSTAFDPAAASAMLIGALFTDAIARERMPDMFTNDAHDAIAEYVRIFLRGIGVAA
jgi:AcrR family transcriptional regulator